MTHLAVQRRARRAELRRWVRWHRRCDPWSSWQLPEDRTETDALARARALVCDVPDPERVVRVTYDGAPRFHYDDGRPAYSLPPIEETT